MANKKELELPLHEKEIDSELEYPSVKREHPDYELICELEEERDALNNELADLYANGGEGVARDLPKSTYYRKKARNPADSDLPNLDDEDSILGYFAKYTSARLFLLQTDTILGFFGKSFLPRLFGIAGLSYGLEFFTDLGIVFYNTFRAPQTQNEALQSHWQRFKNNLMKGKRPDRMWNSGFWFVINLTAFILSGGVASLAINVAGFAIDVALEITKGISNVFSYKKREDKIVEEIAEKRKLLITTDDPESRNQLNRDIRKLEIKQAALHNKTDSVFKDRMYGVFLTTMFTAGLVMTFFPPTMAIGVGILTFSLALGVESKLHQIVDCVSGLFSRFLHKKPSNDPAIELKEKKSVSLQQQDKFQHSHNAIDNGLHKKSGVVKEQQPVNNSTFAKEESKENKEITQDLIAKENNSSLSKVGQFKSRRESLFRHVSPPPLPSAKPPYYRKGSI